MTREEMEARVEWLEERLFWINMVDRWTDADRSLYVAYSREQNELLQELSEK